MGVGDRQTVKVSVCAFITWETFARWRSQPIVAGPDRVAGAYVLESRSTDTHLTRTDTDVSTHNTARHFGEPPHKHGHNTTPHRLRD